MCVCVCVCVCVCSLFEAFGSDHITPFPQEGMSSQSGHLGGVPAACLALALEMGIWRGKVRVIRGGKARPTALA